MEKFRKKNQNIYDQYKISTAKQGPQYDDDLLNKLKTKNLKYYKKCMLLRQIKEKENNIESD